MWRALWKDERITASTQTKAHHKVPAVIRNKAQVLIELAFKGAAHPKMNILSLFAHSHVILSLYAVLFSKEHTVKKGTSCPHADLFQC